MKEIKITVKGATGSGKSHVMAIIEKAVLAEYGPLMKVECQELNSERNLIGKNLDAWNKPNPTQVYINLVEENVPGSRQADLSKARPTVGAIMDIPQENNKDAPEMSAILIDCIDPSLSGALSVVLETHSIVSAERTMSGYGKRQIDITLTFDAKLIDLSRNLFSHLKDLAAVYTHNIKEFGSIYLISTVSGVFERAILISLYGATAPVIRDGRGFITLSGFDDSPSTVNKTALEAWENRNKPAKPETIEGHRHFVPSITCPPFSE